MLQGLRSLGFAPPSYAPTKLSPGYGREVCALLDGLADVTLERRGTSINRPVYQADRCALGFRGWLPAWPLSTLHCCMPQALLAALAAAMSATVLRVLICNVIVLFSRQVVILPV